MNTNRKVIGLLMLPLMGMALSCKKDNNENNTGGNEIDPQQEILADLAKNVCLASYEEMYAKALNLQTAVTTLLATETDANLAAAQTAWREVRAPWEQSEAWLFGPVDTDDIDPRIDTWPVDFNQLDSVLTSGSALTESYVDGLTIEALKGFHPTEYLLWGKDGNKKANAFTSQERDYLKALVANLVKLSKEVRDTWKDSYADQLATAGAGSEEFKTRQEAFLEIADKMQKICNEVAEEKIKEPFEAEDPMLEESPFAQNSFTDFRKNIEGVMLMYQGKFGTKDGKGMEDLVREYNLSLDQKIKAAHVAALASIDAFGQVPFGEAITTRASDLQNAMDKINALKALLDDDLPKLIRQRVTK